MRARLGCAGTVAGGRSGGLCRAGALASRRGGRTGIADPISAAAPMPAMRAGSPLIFTERGRDVLLGVLSWGIGGSAGARRHALWWQRSMAALPLCRALHRAHLRARRAWPRGFMCGGLAGDGLVSVGGRAGERQGFGGTG